MNEEWQDIIALIIVMGICIFLCLIIADPTSRNEREKNCFDVVNEQTQEFRD